MVLHTNYLLYMSHALSRWGDRMWSFAIGIFLVYLHPESLLVTATYLLINRVFVLLLSGPIGKKVDRLPERLPAMRTALLVQNSSVSIAAVLTIVAFHFQISYHCERLYFFIIMAFITLLGVVSFLSSSASKMIIERDWVVVLCRDDADRLSSINANMRRIDQVCVLLAPIVAGAFMSGFSTTWAAVLIAVWNIVSFFVEYSLLRVVYSRVPQLAVKTVPPPPTDASEGSAAAGIFCFTALRNTISSFFNNFSIFMSQEVALLGFCLSLVYLTVLGFSSVTLGYLRLNNVKDLYIAITMGAGAMFGILGTVCFTPFTKKYGVSACGVFGAVCLAVSYAISWSSVAFPRGKLNSPDTPAPANTNRTCGEEGGADALSQITGSVNTHTIVLLVGITTIRFGLWIYDLAISQLFQMSVPEPQRNTVGGIQSSLNSFFDCLFITLTVIMPDPNQFGILIIVSCVACIGSCVTFIGWFVKTGGIEKEKVVIQKEAEEKADTPVNAETLKLMDSETGGEEETGI